MQQRHKDFSSWYEYLLELPLGLKPESLLAMRRVAARLGLNHLKPLVITVTGTNGKGSTVRFLEQILLASGYKVGAYTSPHILRYNERIRVNNKDVSDKSLCDAFTKIEVAKNSCQAELSFFEFTTLTALEIFSRAKLDVIILEVGMGGRLDATNMVDADLAVITSVDLDHTHVLGSTRYKIGAEKTGIMRPGRSLVCGADMPMSVRKAAQKIAAPMYELHKDFTFKIAGDFWQWQAQDGERIFQLALPALDIENAAIALMVIKILRFDFAVPTKLLAIKKGVAKSKLPGRLQKICSNPEVFCDVSHNPAAIKRLAGKIKNLPKRRTVAVFSMLHDKDILSSLKYMLDVIDVWYMAPLQGKRAASLVELNSYLLKAGVKRKQIQKFTDITAAYSAACKKVTNEDRIIAFGSFYVVAEVLKSSHI